MKVMQVQARLTGVDQLIPVGIAGECGFYTCGRRFPPESNETPETITKGLRGFGNTFPAD